MTAAGQFPYGLVQLPQHWSCVCPPCTGCSQPRAPAVPLPDVCTVITLLVGPSGVLWLFCISKNYSAVHPNCAIRLEIKQLK